MAIFVHKSSPVSLSISWERFLTIELLNQKVWAFLDSCCKLQIVTELHNPPTSDV